MKKSFILSILFILLSVFLIQAQSFNFYPELVELKNEYRNQSESVSEYTSLKIDDEIRQQLFTSRPKHLKLKIPLTDAKTFDLDLYEFKVVSDDFMVKTSDGTIVDYNPGIFYKGTINGEDGFATLSISEDHIMGIISSKRNGNFNFGKMKNSDEYVIFNDKDFLRSNDFVCHTPDSDDLGIDPSSLLSDHYSGQRSLSDCVKLYIEGDNALRINKGGVSEASDYIMDLVSVVAVLYDNESINVEISEIMIWTSPDGYSTSNSSTALDQFESNNPNPNGDLAHLFALGGNGTGGLAWVDVLCGGPNYAYSNISSWFNNFPTYSWTIEVVSHEMGHNIGSPHTHNCSWPGGAIDNCAATEGSCAPGPAPTNGGTIMSYCHTQSSGINFNNGFGPLPGNLIRDKVDAAFCLSACTGGIQAPIADFSFNFGNGCAPSTVDFFDVSANAPTDWLWIFVGGTPSSSTEQNPTVVYDLPGLYDVSLTVTNGGGADETIQYGIIEVITEPVVDFTFNVEEKTVNFTNITTSAYSYIWSFGDGNNTSSQNPNHTYEEDGVYVVTLVGINDCGSPSITHNVTIATLPEADYSATDTTGCPGFGVTFINNSSNNSDDFTWEFEGGTPATSIEETPTVVYEETGLYDVSLIVTNEQGSDTLLMEEWITVYEVPIASFTSSVNGPIVVFTADTYVDTDYSWDFGDGASSTDQNPIHEYQSEGVFEVVLITDNSYCTDTASTMVNILFTPQIVFDVDITEGCVALEINFNNQTEGNNTYLWTFEGGSPASSTEESPTIMYINAGEFDVTLEATNTSGSSTLISENYIIALDIPSVAWNHTVNELEVSFDNESSNAATYLWDFGDGSNSTEENPSHIYSEENVYTISLISTSPCGSMELVKDVNLFTEPTAGYSSDEVSGCIPLTVNYVNESSNNVQSWLWTFEGGSPASSTEESPEVVYNEDGVFSTSLTVTNATGSNTFENDIYINAYEVPLAIFEIELNGPVASFNTPDYNNTDYLWDFGDGNASEMQNPSHEYGSEGDFLVTLISSNLNCADTSSENITIVFTPVVVFGSNIVEGCVPLTVDFTNQTEGDNTYEWIFVGGNPSSSTEMVPSGIIYEEAGVFDVRLMATNTAGTTELIKSEYIIVHPKAESNFSWTAENNNITFINESQDAISYLWDFGDGTTNEENNPLHTYEHSGLYDVLLIATNDCGMDTILHQINVVIDGVDDSQLFDKLIIYPNPVDEVLILDFNNIEQSDIQLYMYDIFGRNVLQSLWIKNKNANVLSLDLKEVISGSYILKIRKGDVQKLEKIIVY